MTDADKIKQIAKAYRAMDADEFYNFVYDLLWNGNLKLMWNTVQQEWQVIDDVLWNAMSQLEKDELRDCE